MVEQDVVLTQDINPDLGPNAGLALLSQKIGQKEKRKSH